jgi:hypothetical protein
MSCLPQMHCGLLLLFSREPPYRYDKFPTLLQSQQTQDRLGLYLRVTSSLVGHCSYWAPGPSEYLWCRQPCCANVGSGFPLIPVYSGIFILLLDTINKYSLGPSEYLDATFKSSWKGSSHKWYLVDIHTEPQWTNKHLLPPSIDDKRREPELTPRLKALVGQVTELRRAGLRACHCSKEFTLQWIHQLGRREKLAFECPRLADPAHDSPAGKILNSIC